jgi:predicted esterase
MKPIRIFITLLFLTLAGLTQAQNTGSFNVNITFNSEQRTLSLYVPVDYDSTVSYQLMVGLHGLGDNSSNYRNALINQLNWNQHFSNAIFVFPDGGNDQLSDFYTPEGDELIIEAAIDYVNEHYNIDNDKIILQGFSLGGASALKYGLDNSGRFMGLLLNTPAIQGVLDAQNEPDIWLTYAYENASGIPIYISNGALDEIYLNPIDTAFFRMVKENGIIEKNTVSGLGHTIAPFSELGDVIPFFENKHLVENTDLDVLQVYAPSRNCDNEIFPSVLVRNRGQNPINSLELALTADGQTETHQWNGALNTYEHAVISLPSLQVSHGDHELELSVITVNGEVDSITFNNSASTSFQTALSAVSLPLTESFEGSNYPPENWVLGRSGNFFYWDHDQNTNRAVSANTLLLFASIGMAEDLITPLMDFSGTDTVHLRFDMAYNYHRYAIEDTFLIFADTLQVDISTDCGATYETIFRKGGEDLASFDEPIGPLSFDQLLINPGEEDWRHVAIDLSAYAGEEGAMLRFRYISGQGGGIALDKVMVSNKNLLSLSDNHIRENVILIYPNPANNELHINAKRENIDNIRIYDNTGRLVITVDSRILMGEASSEVLLNVQELKEGLYFLIISTESGIYREKFLKN